MHCPQLRQLLVSLAGIPIGRNIGPWPTQSSCLVSSGQPRVLAFVQVGSAANAAGCSTTLSANNSVPPPKTAPCHPLRDANKCSWRSNRNTCAASSSGHMLSLAGGLSREQCTRHPGCPVPAQCPIVPECRARSHAVQAWYQPFVAAHQRPISVKWILVYPLPWFDIDSFATAFHSFDLSSAVGPPLSSS